MSVIPCQKNSALEKLIREYAEALKTEAHKLGTHGLTEKEFYNSGIFRGAIERTRGQFSATMREKREFVRHVLNYMQDRGFIQDWESAGEANRHDYVVRLKTGRVGVIELKGCLDGNNTTIFERPSHAQEFIIWSVCTNQGADPQKNAWSGIHTRLSADIIERQQRVDGVMIWDMVCGTVGRPCPKLVGASERATAVAHYMLAPPCIYIFPATIASPRNNPKPVAQSLDDVQLLKAFHECFRGKAEEVNYVDFEVEHRGAETMRKTRIRRTGAVVQESKLTAIQRT
jgi:ribosomal protein S8